MNRAEPVDQSLLLDSQLCFLVYRLHRGITDLYRPLLTDLGLTYPQYLVMLVLWESAPQTVSEIGDRVDLDSGTLSPLLKRLETAGLIARARAAFDERAVEVTLTPAGRALRRKARAVPAEIGECLAASPADYWQVREQLTALLARVDRATTSAAIPASDVRRG
jgi:DNA-binding MarR family transcriptional regulator